MVNRNVIVSLVVAAGLGAVFFAFLGNASPYVDAATALKSTGDDVHVAGTIKPETLRGGGMKVAFTLKDEAGTELPVSYDGDPIANLATATKVVAIGHMQGGQFHSTKMLVKCPSKYESVPAQSKA